MSSGVVWPAAWNILVHLDFSLSMNATNLSGISATKVTFLRHQHVIRSHIHIYVHICMMVVVTSPCPWMPRICLAFLLRKWHSCVISMWSDHIYMCICTYMYDGRNACRCVQTYIYIYIYIYTYIHLYIHIYVNTYM